MHADLVRRFVVASVLFGSLLGTAPAGAQTVPPVGYQTGVQAMMERDRAIAAEQRAAADRAREENRRLAVDLMRRKFEACESASEATLIQCSNISSDAAFELGAKYQECERIRRELPQPPEIDWSNLSDQEWVEGQWASYQACMDSFEAASNILRSIDCQAYAKAVMQLCQSLGIVDPDQPQGYVALPSAPPTAPLG